MNTVDRVISWLSPERGLRRMQARLVMDAARGLGRPRHGASQSHRGGIQTRTSTPWTARMSYRGGTAAERQNLAERRNRARRVFEEHPVGRGLLQTETDNIVADGFALQVRSANPDFNREAERRWVDWLDRADLRGLRCGSELQRLAYRSSRRDGDGGFVLVDRGGESRLQWIPGDLISTPMGKAGDTTILHGVEVDNVGAPRAFWIRENLDGKASTWTRVAANNFVYLAPVIDDDLGVRGDSCYSQVFSLLDGLDGYVDAVVIAARLACVFGLIFKEKTAGQQFAQLSTLTNSQGNSQKALTLENGMLKYVGTEDDVVQVQAQQPMSQTPDFIRAVMRLLGIPFDMPLELVAHDMSQVNFASARIGLLGYYRACRARQKWFVRTALSRIFRWWISREVKIGNIAAAAPADFLTHQFVSVGWDYTDPVSEAQGDLLQIDMGIKTPQMVAAERGRDFEDMQEDLAVARMIRRAKELPAVGSTMTRDRVEVEADNSEPEPVADDGLTFKRDVLKSFLSVPAAREVIFNATEIGTLVTGTGLAAQPGYDAPYIPVVAPTGPLVSGATIQDPEGGIVGGDIENELPADDDARNGSPDGSTAAEHEPAPEHADDEADHGMDEGMAGEEPAAPGAEPGHS